MIPLHQPVAAILRTSVNITIRPLKFIIRCIDVNHPKLDFEVRTDKQKVAQIMFINFAERLFMFPMFGTLAISLEPLETALSPTLFPSSL